MGNLTINNGGIIINSDTLPNVDLRYGPYNSIEDANTALNGHKIPGLTVGIKQAGGIIKEYWYQYENGILTLTPTITNEGTITGINVAGTEITPDTNGTITLPIDTTPKDGSTNIITSGAVYSGLGGKQDNIQDLNQIRSNATTAIQPGTLASTLGDIEISRPEQYDIAANLTNRTADIDQTTNEVKALGYMILNPNASFTNQVVASNTSYEIRDEFNLESGSVTIPANCTLKFNGGKLSNGTINFNNCYIDSPNVQIFGTDMDFANLNVKNTELVATWFGFTPENTDVTQLNKVIAFGCNIFIPKGDYLLTSSIVKTTSNLGRIRGEMRNTFLKSTTCDIFNVRKLEISNFKIRAEGYYGIKDNNGYLKVIDNDIQACAVGIGNELGTPINKMETEITQNTIQYCTDCGIKYHGSVNGSQATDGFISGLLITSNYIVKAGTGVDNYTTSGTEGFGYGIDIKDVYTAIITNNVMEYCSCGGLRFEVKDYVSTNVSIKYNRFEQNKRYQIGVVVPTENNVRGVEITNNSSLYPYAKVDNFIKEWYLTGCGIMNAMTTILFDNNIFGFNRNNLLKIQDLYTYCVSLYAVGILGYDENAVIKNITNNNSIDLYKRYRIQKFPISYVQKGKRYVVQFNVERKIATSISGYYFLKISGAGVDLNVSSPNLSVNTISPHKCFIVPTSNGFIEFTGSYFTGNTDSVSDDTVMYKITDLSIVESETVIVSSLSEIKAINSSAKGCRAYVNGYSRPERIYNGTTWVEEDGEAAGIRRTGTSSQRPTPENIGFEYYDTTLNKPIFWNGTIWTDANGEAIELTVSDTTILIGAAVNSTANVNVYYAGSTAPTIDVLNPDNTANNWLIATLTGNTLALTLDGTNGANTTTSPRGAKILITLGTEVVIINVVQAAGSSN